MTGVLSPADKNSPYRHKYNYYVTGVTKIFWSSLQL